jgi:hypothetical protein
MREKPPTYGQWWARQSRGAPWYAEIFAARQSIHDAFIAWVTATEQREAPFQSVLEVGCGCAVVYPGVFAERDYMGYDVSWKEIAWCRANRTGRARYRCGDFLVEMERPTEKFDLVFSHAVVDHVYDVEVFIEACVKQSTRWVYLTAYRGWFPELTEHRYLWDERTTSFYNDLSPSAVLAQLHALGCMGVRVEPVETGKPEIPLETVIIARAPLPPGSP